MSRPVITPELIAHHRRLAGELRNAAIRKAMMDVACALSKLLGFLRKSRVRKFRPLATSR